MAKKEKDLQEQKKKVEDFSKELKAFSDEELDQVAGGFYVAACPDKCDFNPLRYNCICPEDGTVLPV